MGTLDIQSNRAHSIGPRPPNPPRYLATADAGQSDVEATLIVNIPDTLSGGLALRATDHNNFWLIGIWVGGNLLRLHERNGGVWITRSEVSKALSSNTDYTLTATANGQTITGSLNDGGSGVSYNSATLNETVTTHGMHFDPPDSLFDHFRVDAL